MTFAERAANVHEKTSLIVERKNHIGGNAYDHYDDYGVLIHQYGPDYFRTNSPKIKDYLYRFTEWHPVD
jgi:UDP-galactopyranose mutase